MWSSGPDRLAVPLPLNWQGWVCPYGWYRAIGRQAWTVVCDMGNPAECETVCQKIVAELGPVDVLINNVGNRNENVPIEQESLATWQELIDLNLTSCFLATKIVGGAMLARGRGGRIINIASISGLIANRGIAGRHYETAKAAVIQFTRATAADWAPRGVTVNAILPGGFMTEPNQRWARESPDVINEFKAQIPMGEFGRPEDLGPLAVYLASEASRYMTGASLVIDGGYTLW